MHTFYRLDDGSCLAFFEAPDLPFHFKPQHDFDLHIALEVDAPILFAMLEQGKQKGIETRGVSDHGFIHSIYFRDPNGYVVELCTKPSSDEVSTNPVGNDARIKLAQWTSSRSEVGS